jgi:hypothetical protein
MSNPARFTALRTQRTDIKWHLQLNVRNVFDDDDMVPVVAQPDGSIASWIAPVGRTFNLKSTFEF